MARRTTTKGRPRYCPDSRLARHRAEVVGLTIDRLATKVGLNRSLLMRYELGQVRNPDPKMWRAYASGLGLTPEEALLLRPKRPVTPYGGNYYHSRRLKSAEIKLPRELMPEVMRVCIEHDLDPFEYIADAVRRDLGRVKSGEVEL